MSLSRNRQALAMLINGGWITSTCGGKGWNGTNLQVKILCVPPSPSLVPPRARNLDWHIPRVPHLGDLPVHVF